VWITIRGRSSSSLFGCCFARLTWFYGEVSERFGSRMEGLTMS
jgi:hypothetical protein